MVNKKESGISGYHIDNTILQSLSDEGILDDIFISRDMSEEEDVLISSDSSELSQANQLPHVSNNIVQEHNGLLTSDINEIDLETQQNPLNQQRTISLLAHSFPE